MSYKNHNQENPETSLMKAQGELLEFVLRQEADYPWNSAEPGTESYWHELEQEHPFLDWSAAEVTPRSQALFAQLNSCWESVDSQLLGVSLSEKFGSLVPQSWLEEIAQQAQQLIASNLSRTEQLIQTVKPLLTDWAQEDLEVFARPFAYATRGSLSAQMESTFHRDSLGEWQNLSAIKQARYAMMAAHYALINLQVEE